MTVAFSYFGFVSYVVCQNDKQQPFDNLVQSFPVNLMAFKGHVGLVRKLYEFTQIISSLLAQIYKIVKKLI